MTPRRVTFDIFEAHQWDAINAIMKEKDKANPLIVAMPTGTGKTAVMAAAPFVLMSKRTLVVAPDKAIFRQLKDNLMGEHHEHSNVIYYELKFFPPGSSLPSVEAVDMTKKLDVSTLRGRDLVLANAAKFHTRANSEWKELLPADHFDLVIVDEAHHMPSEMWKQIVVHFKEARKLFITATPYRAGSGAKKKIVDDSPELKGGRIVYHFPLEVAIERYEPLVTPTLRF